MGSGLGSVSNQRLLNAIGVVMQAIVPQGLKISADPVPLVDAPAEGDPAAEQGDGTPQE